MRYTIALLALLCLSVPAVAQQVTFAWDAHPEAAQITGFKLYQAKSSGSYGATAAATFTGGDLTTGTIPQPALGRYYFVLTAFVDDPSGILESPYSNEVTLVLKPKAPKLINAVQTAVMAPFRAAKWLVAGGQEKKNLKIVK
jgi:hypothetical protein